jgi:hypothetical protein
MGPFPTGRKRFYNFRPKFPAGRKGAKRFGGENDKTSGWPGTPDVEAVKTSGNEQKHLAPRRKGAETKQKIKE